MRWEWLAIQDYNYSNLNQDRIIIKETGTSLHGVFITRLLHTESFENDMTEQNETAAQREFLQALFGIRGYHTRLTRGL